MFYKYLFQLILLFTLGFSFSSCEKAEDLVETTNDNNSTNDDNTNDNDNSNIKNNSAKLITISDFSNLTNLTELNSTSISSSNNIQNRINSDSIYIENMPSTNSSTTSEKCSWEVSFDKNKFTKDEEGNYENALDDMSINDCYKNFDGTSIYSLHISDIEILDKSGNNLNLEGMINADLSNLNIAETKYRMKNYFYIDGLMNQNILKYEYKYYMSSSSDSSCIIDQYYYKNECTFRSLDHEISDSKKYLKVISFKPGLKRSSGRYFTDGTIYFQYNNWNGVMTYDSDSSTPPTYIVTNGSKTLSGIYTYEFDEETGSTDQIAQDTVAPKITEVIPVNSSTTDTTPLYVFSCTEEGKITYYGSCTSNTINAEIGYNNIIFDELSAGTYSNCKIKVTDSSGNESNLLDVSKFTIESVVAESNNDPLYQYQWYIKNTGQKSFSSTAGKKDEDLNMTQTLSDNITGKNIKIAVVDTGLEINHLDLKNNVLINESWDFVDEDNDPTPYDKTKGDHGTKVAGLIAMEDSNYMGGRGIAPDANIVGYNLLANQKDSNVVAALGGSSTNPKSDDVMVFNLSYGLDLASDSQFDNLSTEYLQIKYGFENLRNGKGAIYIKASGNGYESFLDGSCSFSNLSELPCQNANMTPDQVTPYTILVGSLNAKGIRSSYSTPGSNLWITAYGGEAGLDGELSFSDGKKWSCSGVGDCEPSMLTTDLQGCSYGSSKTLILKDGIHKPKNRFEDNSNGLNVNCNYTSAFQGTSASAPIATGVIALILEANPNLTVRQLKYILAKTARKVDSDNSGISVNLNDGSYLAELGWEKNQAGFNFHNWYGFGAIDVDSAIAFAKSNDVKNFSTMQTCSWRKKDNLSKNIPDKSKNGVTDTINITDNISFIEGIQIELSATHSWIGDLGIELKSPNNTKSILLNIENGFGSDEDIYKMRLLSNAFYGEQSSGNWTIKVVDGRSITTGKLNSWRIRAIGEGNCNTPEEEDKTEIVEQIDNKNYTSNNSAILTGDVIGSATTSNSLLSKPLSISLLNSNNNFSLGTPMAGRSDSSTETIYWTIPVTNISSIVRCFIKADTIKFYDNHNYLIADNTGTYISGSVGKKYGNTSTCLAPSESGYFSGIETAYSNSSKNLFSLVNKVEIKSLESSSGYTINPIKVIPVDYTYTKNFFSGELSIKIKNNSAVTVYGGFDNYFLLDNNGNAIKWGFIDLDKINPNSDGYATEKYIFYDGSVNKIRVFIDYDTTSYLYQKENIENCDNLSNVEFEECYSERRNVMIDDLKKIEKQNE